MSVRRPVTPEDFARRRELDARAYRRKRARFYAEKRRGARCGVVRGRVPCNTVLLDTVDRLGRVIPVCPRCERRRAGVCRTCPRPVAGRVGWAEYCADCRRVAMLAATKRWVARNRAHKNALQRAYNQRKRERAA